MESGRIACWVSHGITEILDYTFILQGIDLSVGWVRLCHLPEFHTRLLTLAEKDEISREKGEKVHEASCSSSRCGCKHTF